MFMMMTVMVMVIIMMVVMEIVMMVMTIIIMLMSGIDDDNDVNEVFILVPNTSIIVISDIITS